MYAAVYGDIEATKRLETEWGFDPPIEIIQEGLKKNARFSHFG